jgi:hypothetical protein
MTAKIIKNAGPVPPLVRNGKTAGDFTPKYLFHLLEEGDAFDVEGTGEVEAGNRYKNWKSAYAMATAYGKRHGKKFVGRRVSEKVMRFWRIS